MDAVDELRVQAGKYEVVGVRSKEKVERAGEGAWLLRLGYGITNLEEEQGEGGGGRLGLGAGDATGDRVMRRVAPLNALLVGIGNEFEERA